MKSLLIILVLSLLAVTTASASDDSVTLKNGDRLTGTILTRNDSELVIENVILGTLSIPMESVSKINDKSCAVSDDKTECSVEWTREVSAGFTAIEGNTKERDLSMDANFNRKTDRDEFTAKANIYYQKVDGEINAEKVYSMLRYAYSFWENKWYNFYKVTGERDRLSNITYRVTPSTGLGYWYSDTKELKLMTEAGIGVQRTEYRDSKSATTEPVLATRAYFVKSLFGESRISEDLSYYPEISDFNKYLIRSETAFINPISGNFFLKLSLIDEYNSDPGEGIDKNDLKFISSVGYSF